MEVHRFREFTERELQLVLEAIDHHSTVLYDDCDAELLERLRNELAVTIVLR